MPNLDERRSQPRAGLVAPAVVFLANERFDCRVIDISTGGIALRSPLAHTPGQFLRINVAFAPQGGISRWLEADGIVVRATPYYGGAVVGVHFAVVDDRFIREVHAYVANERSNARPAIPDALHPPPSTGEFAPHERADGASAAPGTASSRGSTAEYGAVEPESSRPQANALGCDATRDYVELQQLYRDALREVAGDPRRARRWAKQ